MNKKFKFITGIILISITGIVGMAGWFLYHLISNEKGRQGRGYEQVITDAKDKLSMQSAKREFGGEAKNKKGASKYNLQKEIVPHAPILTS